MPEAPARARVQRDEGIGEQVRPEPVAAPEVGAGRFGGRVHDPALLVDRMAGPVGRAAGRFPRLGRPGVVAVLARTRNRVEDPPQPARAHVERPKASRRRFADEATDDQQVLVDHAGRIQQGVRRRRFDAHPLPEMDGAVFTEAADRQAGARVQRVEPCSGGREDPSIDSRAFPVDQATLPVADIALTLSPRVELPQHLPGRRIQRDDVARRRRRVEHAVDDQVVGLELSLVACLVGPGHLELRHVGPVDLIEGRVMGAARVPEVRAPVVAGGWWSRRRSSRGAANRQHEESLQLSGGVSYSSGAAAQRDQPIAREAGPAFALTVRPLHHNRVERRRGTEAEMRARIARGEVAAVGLHAPPQRRPPGSLDADPARRTRSGCPGAGPWRPAASDCRVAVARDPDPD